MGSGPFLLNSVWKVPETRAVNLYVRPRQGFICTPSSGPLQPFSDTLWLLIAFPGDLANDYSKM